MSDHRRAPRQVPPPPGEPAANPYARFIPSEEIRSVTAWSPGAFTGPERRSANGDRRRAPPPVAAPAPPDPEQIRAAQALAVKAARQAGYQDGYRDGLVALESFKQTYAQQVTAQVGQLIDSHAQQLDALHGQLAAQVTKVAVQLARQVLRTELALHPQRVAHVAREALDVLLASARRIELHAHPDDLALIEQGAAEVLERRAVRLVPDATQARGGCRVESDIGQVDATITSRWAAAAALLGRPELPWEAPPQASQAAAVDGPHRPSADATDPDTDRSAE